MKVLETDERPSRSLSLYAASGALAVAYPELEALVGRDPGVGVPDAWTEGLLAADLLPSHRPLLRLATLLMGVGIPEEVPGDAESFGRREDGMRRDGDLGGGAERAEERVRAARRAAALLTRLRFSNADTDRVASLVRVGPHLPGGGATAAAHRRWLAAAGADRLPDLVRIAAARTRLHGAAGVVGAVEEVVEGARDLRDEVRRRPPLTVGDVALDGRDLIRMGLRPGPRFGHVLEELLERVLEDPSLNRPETLARMVRDEIAPDLFEEQEGEDTTAGGSRRRGT